MDEIIRPVPWPTEKLDETKSREPLERAKATGFKGLQEDGIVALAIVMACQDLRQHVLQRQAERAKIGGMFGLNVEADVSASCAARLPNQVNHFLQGWNGKLPVEALTLRAQGRHSLDGTQSLKFRQAEIY